MCLAIPGRVIAITDDNGVLMGRIDFAGTVNAVCLAYVPEVQVGQYVIVHAGFALSIVDEEEAQKTFALWDEMAAKAAEEGLDLSGRPLAGDDEMDKDNK